MKIEDIISTSLQSIINYKVKYIKFCMKRYTLQCIENSPLAIKVKKAVVYGINYISILGFDTT